MKSKYKKYDSTGLIQDIAEFEDGWFKANHSFGHKFNNRIATDLVCKDVVGVYGIEWFDLVNDIKINKEEARRILRTMNTPLYKAIYD